MPKEEPLLAIVVNIHGYDGATRRENNNIFIRELGPLEIQAFVRRVPNNVLELKNRILVKLRRSF